jgi:hypothetical protein
MEPHEPRLASSKASISDSGVDACLNRIHFACDIPLERQTDIAAFAKVANRAIRAFKVMS